MNRRKFLVVTGGTASATTLAGCLGILDDDDNGDGTDDNGDDDSDNGGEPDPPTATFVWEPEEPTVGETVEFDASESASGDRELVEFRWSIDGEAHTGETLSHTFDQTGEVSVEVEVEDDNGQTDTASELLSIGDSPKFDEAIGSLIELAAELDELVRVREEQFSANLNTVSNQVETTKDAVESAEAVGVENDQIEAIRAVFTFQQGLLEVHEKAAEINPDEQVDTGFRLLDEALSEADSPGQVDASVVDEIIEEIATRPSVEDQQTRYDDLEAEREALDTSPLDDPAVQYDDNLSEYLRYGIDEIESMATFADAYKEYFRSFGAVITGWNHFEAEAWEDAEGSFADAESILNDAIAILDGIDEEAVPDGAELSTDLIMFFENIQEVFGEFRQTATMASEGDVEEAKSAFESLIDELF